MIYFHPETGLKVNIETCIEKGEINYRDGRKEEVDCSASFQTDCGQIATPADCDPDRTVMLIYTDHGKIVEVIRES